MRVHRAFRRWVSGGLVMLLLFMQLATAAYACPTELRTLHGEAATATMPGCDGNMPRTMDADQPQLCKAHCQQGERVVGAGATVGDWTPVPLLLTVLKWQRAAQTDLAPARTHSGPWSDPPLGAAAPGSPPIYLSLLVLRN